MDLSLILIDLITKYPILGSIVAVMGILRLIMKPAFTFLKQAVDATPSEKDNLLLSKVEGSKAYKVIVFLLDYVASIKLKK